MCSRKEGVKQCQPGLVDKTQKSLGALHPGLMDIYRYRYARSQGAPRDLVDEFVDAAEDPFSDPECFADGGRLIVKAWRAKV